MHGRRRWCKPKQFMENETTEEEIEKIKEKFENVSNIDKYSFKSKQQVKEEMQAESDIFNTVLSNWEDDESPLKDTFQIKVKNVKKIGETAEEIKNMDALADYSDTYKILIAAGLGKLYDFLDNLNYLGIKKCFVYYGNE